MCTVRYIQEMTVETSELEQHRRNFLQDWIIQVKIGLVKNRILLVVMKNLPEIEQGLPESRVNE